MRTIASKLAGTTPKLADSGDRKRGVHEHSLSSIWDMGEPEYETLAPPRRLAIASSPGWWRPGPGAHIDPATAATYGQPFIGLLLAPDPTFLPLGVRRDTRVIIMLLTVRESSDAIRQAYSSDVLGTTAHWLSMLSSPTIQVVSAPGAGSELDAHVDGRQVAEAFKAYAVLYSASAFTALANLFSGLGQFSVPLTTTDSRDGDPVMWAPSTPREAKLCLFLRQTTPPSGFLTGSALSDAAQLMDW